MRGWGRTHGMRNVVLRLANVYGPRQEAGLEGGVVAIFLERMARGEEAVVFGDGGQTRDFVYVGDVVRALLAAAGREGGVFNVGTGVETSVLDLYRACAGVAGVGAEPRSSARGWATCAARCSTSPSRRASSAGAPEVGLEDGLRLTLEG